MAKDKDKGKDKKKDQSKAPAEAKATALTLLGHSENKLPTSPDEAKLEVFPNRTPGRNYRIN
ncbi:MAG: hypothetical protein ACAH88_20695, partial [Roseimicrobium sp.]